MGTIRRGAAATVLTWSAFDSAAFAARAYSVDYFANPSSAVCTSGNVLGGSNSIQISRRPQLCPDRVAFEQRKGTGDFPWSSETFVVNPTTGFIDLVNEVRTSGSTGNVIWYRAFRDLDTGELGLPWLPASFPYNQGKLWTSNTGVEQWSDPVGALVCRPTSVASTVPTFLIGGVEGEGRWRRWLRDRRARTRNPLKWHDVEVIRHYQLWGSFLENTENYYYGRWRNSETGRWEGLGMVKWEWFIDGELYRENEFRYLVDCPGRALCTLCPE